MGDFNAKVEDIGTDEMVGRYGLDTGNEREERFVQFCLDKVVIQNAWF